MDSSNENPFNNISYTDLKIIFDNYYGMIETLFGYSFTIKIDDIDYDRLDINRYSCMSINKVLLKYDIKVDKVYVFLTDILKELLVKLNTKSIYDISIASIVFEFGDRKASDELIFRDFVENYSIEDYHLIKHFNDIIEDESMELRTEYYRYIHVSYNDFLKAFSDYYEKFNIKGLPFEETFDHLIRIHNEV